MTEIKNQYLQKISCNNRTKKCHNLVPYYKYDFLNNANTTTKEKETNLLKYRNACSNRGGEIKQCCDKNDKVKLHGILKKIKHPKVYGKTEYNRQGKLERIELCKDGGKSKKECGKAFEPLNSYEICKIPQDFMGDIITDFNPDCYDTKCNPQEKIPDINGEIEENYTFEFDKKIAYYIENKNLDYIEHFIEEDPSILIRPLTHNTEGNTVYHEALKHNSEHILLYLFKNANRNIINRTNANGETLLHKAMAIDNPNIIVECMKFGSDINALNYDNESPIYYAIRAGLFNNVLSCINNNADLYLKNKDGETPLVVSCFTEKRQVAIVRLLVNNGSNINNKTKEKKTILQTILEKERIREQEEKRNEYGEVINKPEPMTLEEAEIRTYLQGIKIRSMGYSDGQELSEAETAKLEGILYLLEDKDKIGNKKPNFKITIRYDEKLEEQELHYNKNLDENFMQPYNILDKNFSHSPYYKKYKNTQQDKLKKLRQTILLTRWDLNSDEEKKLELIDGIMEGRIDFENYKHEILHINGITKEQTHLLDNVDDKSLSHFLDNNEDKHITLESKNTTNDKIHNPEPHSIRVGKKKEIRPKIEIVHPAPSIVEEESFFSKNLNLLIYLGCGLSILIIVLVFYLSRKNKDFLNISNKIKNNTPKANELKTNKINNNIKKNIKKNVKNSILLNIKNNIKNNFKNNSKK